MHSRNHYSVFISYNNADEAFARSLYRALTMRGLHAFFAPDSLRAGDSHVSEINMALAACQVGIVIWSQAASLSGYVEAEVGAMHDLHVYQDLRIVIVSLDGTRVPPLFAHLHRLLPEASLDPERVALQILNVAGCTISEATVAPPFPSDHRQSKIEFRTMICVSDLSNMECSVLADLIQRQLKANPAIVSLTKLSSIEFRGAAGRRLGANLNTAGVAAKATVNRARHATEMIEIIEGNIKDAAAASEGPMALMHRTFFERQVTDGRKNLAEEYETLRQCLDLFVTSIWTIQIPEQGLKSQGIDQ